MLKRTLLGLLVLWTGWALLAELRDAAVSWDARAGWRRPAWAWRFGTPQVARLERCVTAARRFVPAGSVVAFVAPDEPKGSGFYHVRWAGYLMPENELVGLEDPATSRVAQYLISAGVPLDDPRLQPRLQPLGRLPGGCRLYRVLPP